MAEQSNAHAQAVGEAVQAYGALADTADAMAKALALAAAPCRVILFGSYAKGSAGPHSDIDLMVIEKAPFGALKSRWQEAVRLHRVLRSFSAPKDVLVFSEDEWAMHGDDPNHVIGQARRYGKVLYEQA